MITESLSPDSRNNTSVAQKSVTFENTSALKQEDNVALKTSDPDEYWKKKDARIVLDVAIPLAVAGTMYPVTTFLTLVCPEALLVVIPVVWVMRYFGVKRLFHDLFFS
jgi:hypothetical protein